jgi:hypothetical protein
MRKVYFIIMVISIFSCKPCLPQISNQYLAADSNCEAIIPNYLDYVSVIWNCAPGSLTQYPPAGTKLTEAIPWMTVTITAKNLSGRTDVEKFTVILDDGIAPEIIWDSIPSDTIPITHVNDIDLLFKSVDDYRAYLGAEPQDNILIRRIRDE